MYKNFFGFSERPFQLVPNPAYLFLSKTHEEALAHLVYAISHGDGFVEITGEVGTGKTTLCRVFLENLGENTEAAYIFNPKLDAIQLLKTINDEFGIDSDPNNTKDLIDKLNDFLMAKKVEGKNVILMIDEAQDLNNEVLEQVRLLSNLETTTSKLLQIILVGQPELADMLDSYELRQLGQRITLSCHLRPLTFKETRDYISHRIHIASPKKGVRFSRAALRLIHKHTRGIPRLINILCERALLNAFVLSKRKITGRVIKGSIDELASRRWVPRHGLFKGKAPAMAAALICLALVGLLFYQPGGHHISNLLEMAQGKKNTEGPESNGEKITVPIIVSQDKETSRDEETPLRNPEVLEEPSMDLAGLLRKIDARSSRKAASEVVNALWNSQGEGKAYLEDLDDDQLFFALAAKQNGLLIYRIEDNFALIEKLNLPAILQFYLPGDLSPRYLTLTEIKGGKVILRGEKAIGFSEVEVDALQAYWSGLAFVVWKDFLGNSGDIPVQSTKDTIVMLKLLLQDVGFNQIEITPIYDARTREAVKKIQEEHGLKADGIVGPLTKIVLSNKSHALKIPHISG